jgi:uncharacterized protein YdaL
MTFLRTVAVFFVFVALSLGAERAVLIVHDGPARPPAKGYLQALFIESLLGHFNLTADTIQVDSYRPGQMARYRAVFFLAGEDKATYPPAFLNDIRDSHQTFCWLGEHIDNLFHVSKGRRAFGFRYIEHRENASFQQVIYKDVPLPKGEEQDLDVVEVTDPKSVEVVATVINSRKEHHPYALHQGRFWFFADTPMSFMEEGGRYLIFCDLLHDILGIQHPSDNRALVRLEDISADSEPSDLRNAADLLAARHIPFQISFIPIYVDPTRGLEIHLSDRHSYADALHYMIARGGAPVMHGVTHQYHGTSADDYEFWDNVTNRPVIGDSADRTTRRIQSGLAECFAAGIYPIAFETPHYAASEITYRAVAKTFTLFSDRIMAAPNLEAGQFFPYPVIDRFGRHVIPEDLGFVEVEKPSTKPVLNAARNMRVVRDGLASFFFHPFLDQRMLAEIVDGMTGMGYHFVSLHDFGGDLNFQGRFLIRTSSGNVQLRPQDEFWRMRTFTRNGQMVSEQVSPKRVRGPVQVAVNVPSGGWAALDCIRTVNEVAQATDWRSRLRHWWQKNTPFSSSVARSFPATRQAWIIRRSNASPADRNNQLSYRSVLETFGFQVHTVEAAAFTHAPREPGAILVVPHGSGVKLSLKQQQEILTYLEHGGSVIMDGKQAWIDKLGVRWSGRYLVVDDVVDAIYPEMSFRWRPEERVPRCTMPEDARRLLTDKESDQALAVGGEFGTGRYLYLVAPLDPYTDDGTSHYPYLAKYIEETFDAGKALRGTKVEAYCDTDYRPGNDLGRVVATWRRNGIRTVYASAWHTYPRDKFDYYDYFIRLCHANGISVYAWFVLPATTKQMWDQHPDWHILPADGSANRPGWRYGLDLENPDCYRAVMDWTKQIISSHNWDGVNLAEINYDADFLNYQRVDRFVPMNPGIRKDFRKRAGFDPRNLFVPGSPLYYQTNPAAFEKFLKYREDVVTEWHRKILSEIDPLRRERGLEVIVTMLDSLHSDWVRPALGVNSHRIVDLMKDFEFTLQVEDHASFWNKPGDRYRHFAETYLKLIPDRRRLMFDVNVMSDRAIDHTTLPSSIATGTELAFTLASAASASGRAAVYSEHTVAPQDWPLIGAALAPAAKIMPSNLGWRIDTPSSVFLPVSRNTDFYVNGRIWPAVSIDGVIAAPGQQELSVGHPWLHVVDQSTLPARLLYLSGDLLDAEAVSTGVIFRYASPGRAVAVVNSKPVDLIIDDHPADLHCEPAGNNWAVTLPRGEHSVTLSTSTRAGVVVNFWSWLSSSAIAIFGTLTTIFMAFIYLQVRLRRTGRKRETA